MRTLRLLLLPAWLLTALACESKDSPCADLDEASCRQNKECRPASGVETCSGAVGYFGCVERDLVCPQGGEWFFEYEGKCIDYEARECVPEGLTECWPECLEQTGGTGP